MDAGRRIARRRRGLPTASAFLLAVAGLAVGCGGGGDDGGESKGKGAPPLGVASAKESVDEARDRIARAVSSKDCNEVKKLIPLSRVEFATQAHCTSLQRLDGLEATGADEHGGVGGVIDYQRGARMINAALIVDEDGRFHIPFINIFNEGETVGTHYAKQFDDAAEQALRALEERDCSAYRDVAFRRLGRGRAEEKVLCNYVENNPIAKLLEAQPDAKFEQAGGNSYYGFYTLSTPGVAYTFVLARQSNRGAPPKAPKLPEGTAEYALVDAYRTNSRSESE